MILQIHDRCYRLGCRWFVVTTYNKWAFGVFSKGSALAESYYDCIFLIYLFAGWTSAFITPPKPYDSVEPTILQCLVFWIQSSMDCSGKWDIDEVSAGMRSRPRYDIRCPKRRAEDEDVVDPARIRRRSSHTLPSRVCLASDFAFTNEAAALAVAFAR